ncbi:MAG: UDP-N-acetylglucosamine--N-acetylmuramyl-(pentapeptide) pyrophosphoryl-undecaprenol N-acetylglucosamine transferase [bacterium]|nr:UDP-N-acetylglucosamine--N-acetylmuramyl-(pentapeptide) pyrophosphoryl-undecaprenol N-acetylglucosamine transferase [bacterium]
MHILLTGGGSGGHVFPLIAIARELKKRADDEGTKLHLHYMGPPDQWRDTLELEGIHVHTVHSAKWRRYPSAENITQLWKLPFGIFEAAWKLFWIMPSAIFSKGGYGSLPAIWVSRLYRIPVMIHESDAIPGIANRFAAKFAKRIFVSFEHAIDFFPKSRTTLVGNPVRPQLAQSDANSAKSLLRLDGKKPILYITGSSLGAQKINEIVVNTLPHLLERYEIIHQCGRAHVDELSDLVRKEYRAELLHDYHLYGFLNESEQSAAYAASDLIIARGSASTIFEIAQAGKPSIVIPLSSAAANHQFENASAYAKHGAAVVLDEQNLTPNLFLEAIANLMESEERRLTMREAAIQFAKPDAAKNIADELFEFALRQ